MAFFCGFALVDLENNYKNLTIDICKRRKELLCEGLELKVFNNPHYCLLYTSKYLFGTLIL